MQEAPERRATGMGGRRTGSVPPSFRTNIQGQSIMIGFRIVVAGLLLTVGHAEPSDAKSRAIFKEQNRMTHIEGTFEVKTTLVTPYNESPEAALGRMALDKTYHGALEAVSQGEMLTAMGNVKGSAGYVAVERVTGTLQGRSGSFALLHRGVMTRGIPELLVTVVPDSGTGALAGISGTMSITITDGKHFYGFDFSLPEKM
jgi:hypothetical protein